MPPTIRCGEQTRARGAARRRAHSVKRCEGGRNKTRGPNGEVRDAQPRRSAQQRGGRSPASSRVQLAQLENERQDGVVTFAKGKSLHVSSLDKVFFKDDGITKGDVMRYYANVSPCFCRC